MKPIISLLVLAFLIFCFIKVCWQAPPKRGLYNDEPNLRPIKDDIFSARPGPETSFEEFIPTRQKLIRLIITLLAFIAASIYVTWFLYQGAFG